VTIEQQIKKRLDLEDHGSLIKARSQRIVVPDQSIVDYFGADTCSIYLNEAREWIENPDGTFTDMWESDRNSIPTDIITICAGIRWRTSRQWKVLMPMNFLNRTSIMLEGLSERLDANRGRCCILEGMREPMFGLPSWLRRNDNFTLTC